MADEATQDGAEPKRKKGLKPLLVGLVLALAGAGSGFAIVAAGFLDGGHPEQKTHAHEPVAVEFLPIEPLVITIGEPGNQRQLRFRAQLEVLPSNTSAVNAVLPRVVDILNGYLRAVDLADIESPTALVRLRAQMLRRIQIVVGDGLVSDLLVSEFVLN